MKYLLVVGFSCNVYRQEPRARLFLGDKLIDEFYISHNTNILNSSPPTFFQDKHILQPISINDLVNTKIKNFPSLQFYEIKINQNHDQLKLRIDIENNDSNSTNGFITKSSLIQLRVCYFFPLHQKLLSRLSKIFNKKIFNKNYAWYYCNKNTIFRLMDNGMRWYGKDQQFNQRFNENLYKNQFNVGGSGYFLCEFIKKYGIFIPRLIKSYRYNIEQLLINYFYNKYQQHANQRNTD